MSESSDADYAETINQASMMLLAMSFRPDLQPSLIDKVIAAVEVRGGRLDEQCFIRFDLHAVFEAIVERTMAILSVALRERLPGIADEIDQAFADKLRIVLGSIAQLFPTI